MNEEGPSQPLERQSPGRDPKAKRNSGLFAFLRWFRPSESRESIHVEHFSSSCESLSSTHSNGTVASFSYVHPSAYVQKVAEKPIAPGPETDTYKARLKQRDKRRENDRNLTLRKKYNLFFNRETLLRTVKKDEEENSRSLPLMTRTSMEVDEEKMHRRTNSESSKTRKAGAYLHVKGKRRAPQPPSTSTMSLRRKKRVAPAPPVVVTNGTKEEAEETVQNMRNEEDYERIKDVVFNDSLRLDHGFLKPAKEVPVQKTVEISAPVSPKPWYKRNKKETASTSVPEVQFMRNSTVDLSLDEVLKITKKDENKRKSGMSFLTNISELDREASEILASGKGLPEIPQFMRPKDEIKETIDTWSSPKRRSAKDLIAKFNAITTKVSVNSAFFKNKQNKQEILLESHKKRIEMIDTKKNNMNPLSKSESASAIKKSEATTPKLERKSWKCPKCSLENEYWRIICHVCSAIKPYFDDFAMKKDEEVEEKPVVMHTSSIFIPPDKLERSKTQIGFSALASYNFKNKKSISLEEKKSGQVENKAEEREKLKKMLIEMKNSLPKRKSNVLVKQNSRASIIIENDEAEEKKEEANEEKNVEAKEEKKVEVFVATTETIYENIKVKKTDSPKPIKVSASAQTSSVLQKKEAEEPPKLLDATLSGSILEKKEAEDLPKPLEGILKKPAGEEKKDVKAVKSTGATPKIIESNNNPKDYELMRPKDFETIYSGGDSNSPARVYANLARNDELSVFFNMPKGFNDFKNNLHKNHKDTIEINRLLRRLETAIAKGELVQASIYAKELAQLKINCSVIRQKSQSPTKKQGFSIEMYVEDKISHRGPFQIEVTESQTVAELKKQVENEFEIPAAVQRWILGKELATNDAATLKDHKITSEKCPIFLYLVAPDASIPSTSKASVETVSNNNFKSKIIAEFRKSEESKKPVIVDVIPKLAEAVVTKAVVIEPEPVEEPLKLDVAAKPDLGPKSAAKSATVPEAAAKPAPLPEAAAKPAPLPEAAAKTEAEDEDNTKTLKPAKEWECHLCTLLNPISSNVCAVCATVRQKEVVTPKRTSLKKNKAPQVPKARDETYRQLMNLDNADLVENMEEFECLICFLDVPPRDGVTLRECLHQFCKFCLANTIEFNEDAEVKCPYRDEEYSCNIALQDREIKALVTPQVYEQHLAKSVAEAENKIGGKAFHCKTPDCKGWCIFEDNVNEFRCPVCRRINCLTCQAIHSGLNCKQYQEKMDSGADGDARSTREMLEEMVRKGEALACPTCQVILMKKWGCDWVRCSMCKTEICWVTKGPRWGPQGRGDTTGGCQCGVNGVKCHPLCCYCH